ncbi:hypothetical protein, variant 2 [Verruconis gallopava]|uniref:FHA domain-containing protein n=1 Tax=Verruconis gallopava TaxID=253628 RepID=A0A0D2AQU8_9PEZI|nr:hypothetical protein, variant 2 [Verruconis gallopava]KIW08900.1 hypothetical protein, variant 2 [Verruconis gallopava]
MASPSSRETKVTMTLQKGEDALTKRVISSESSCGPIQIGRASKTERKQLIPAKDNMWISNPVISRNHAVLTIEKSNLFDASCVYLEDAGSSHGTFVNNTPIKPRDRRQISSGDLIQFGNKVQRGTDEYDPPVYKVTIEHLQRPQTESLSSSTGRSISVPEESEESDVDESNSAVGSTDSHSSPPGWGEEKTTRTSTLHGGMNSPFTDENAPAQAPVANGIASRGASEEYEPSPDVPVVQDTYAELEIEEAQEMDKEEIVYDGPDFKTSDESIHTRQSQAYIPPTYEDYVPQQQVQLPPMDDLSQLPTIQPKLSTYNHYRDGPFAQPPEVYSGITFGVSDDGQTQDNMGYVSHMFPVSAQTSSSVLPSITVTTQELLQNTHESSTKNDMSIRSIINPTPTIGTKRKADELYEAEHLIDNPTQNGDVGGNTESSGGQSHNALTEVKIKAAESKEVSRSTTPPVPHRPKKRLRSSIVTHLGAFAFGGVAMLAGLMSLPDNFFG